MINKEKYEEYYKAYEFNPESNLELLNADEVKKFEVSEGKECGIIDNQPFYDIVLSVYRNRNTNRIFRYPNIKYPENKKGAATLVILKSPKEDLYLLELHYREFLGKSVWEIPRGFGINSDAIQTALNEIKEETNIELCNKELTSLGMLHPDTGLTNNQVELFYTEIEVNKEIYIKNNDKEENIQKYIWVSENQFKEMIKNNSICDSFTLAAFLRYNLINE